jgi:hypothetical protein
MVLINETGGENATGENYFCSIDVLERNIKN